jgi:hypothetical protein
MLSKSKRKLNNASNKSKKGQSLMGWPFFISKKRGENMSTITRSISIDFNNARYVREKAARFKEAAEAETRSDVAARLYKQVAFLEHEADFLEARARRCLDEYAGSNGAGFRDYVTAMLEEQNEY